MSNRSRHCGKSEQSQTGPIGTWTNLARETERTKNTGTPSGAKTLHHLLAENQSTPTLNLLSPKMFELGLAEMQAGELHRDTRLLSQCVWFHTDHTPLAGDLHLAANHSYRELNAERSSRLKVDIGVEEGAAGAYVAQVRRLVEQVKRGAGNLSRDWELHA